MTTALLRPLAPLRRFCRDHRGVAAVEFAFVAPVLIIFYFGMAETCQLLMAQRRVSHATAALADLITQDVQIGDEEVLQLYEAGCTIMKPFPTGEFRIRITHASLNAAGDQLLVDWSDDNGRELQKLSVGEDLTDDNPIQVETPLASPGDGVVITEVQYDLVSPIGYFLPNATTIHHKAEMRPRRSASVARVAGPAATSTTPKICNG